MRFAHVVPAVGEVPVLAVVSGENLIPVPALFDGAPADLQTLVEGGDALLDTVRAAVADADSASTLPRIPLTDAMFATAVSKPPVILAIGLNYAAPSSELGLKTDPTPTVFVLWPGSLTGHESTVTWPRSLSEAVDYEAELGVIIGRPAHNVTAADALGHVWGYTVVNDITARNIQYSEAQWSRCKSFDGFTPTGPFVVPADALADPQPLPLWTLLARPPAPAPPTDQMVRPVSALIAALSQSATLLPGTLISTGSPGGAGYSRDPQIFLRDRSTVTVCIDGIGELTVHCRMLD